MVNATSQRLDPEAAALARNRARIPRVKLEYPRPKPQAREVFDAKVGTHPVTPRYEMYVSIDRSR